MPSSARRPPDTSPKVRQEPGEGKLSRAGELACLAPFLKNVSAHHAMPQHMCGLGPAHCGPLGNCPGNHILRFPQDPSQGTKQSAERSGAGIVRNNNINSPLSGDAA